MVAAEDKFSHHRILRMGLGEAINRLIKVSTLLAAGVVAVPDKMLVERDLIAEALNQFQLDLALDCNHEGVSDTIDIFQETATTSCCRILPFRSDRRR